MPMRCSVKWFGSTLVRLALLCFLLGAGVGSGCAGGDIWGGDSNCSALSNSSCNASSASRPAGLAGSGGSPAVVAPTAGASATRPAMPPAQSLPDAGAPELPKPDAGAPAAPDASAAPDAGTSASSGDVPSSAHCAPASQWDPAWTEFESEVLRLTNEARAKGADCGSEGKFDATTALTMSPILRCSARLHSADMGEQDYFSHTNLEMINPFQRMMMAGYSGQAMGENIAKGQQTPEEVVSGWLESDGHCANIMGPMYTEIGVGYWEGEAESRFFNGNKLWTQNFGRPRATRN